MSWFEESVPRIRISFGELEPSIDTDNDDPDAGFEFEELQLGDTKYVSTPTSEYDTRE